MRYKAAQSLLDLYWTRKWTHAEHRTQRGTSGTPVSIPGRLAVRTAPRTSITRSSPMPLDECIGMLSTIEIDIGKRKPTESSLGLIVVMPCDKRPFGQDALAVDRSSRQGILRIGEP